MTILTAHILLAVIYRDIEAVPLLSKWWLGGHMCPNKKITIIHSFKKFRQCYCTASIIEGSAAIVQIASLERLWHITKQN